jgi:hypothetical protein
MRKRAAWQIEIDQQIPLMSNRELIERLNRWQFFEPLEQIAS